MDIRFDKYWSKSIDEIISKSVPQCKGEIN